MLEENYDNGTPETQDGKIDKSDLAGDIVDMCVEDGGWSTLWKMYTGNLDEFRSIITEKLIKWRTGKSNEDV